MGWDGRGVLIPSFVAAARVQLQIYDEYRLGVEDEDEEEGWRTKHREKCRPPIGVAAMAIGVGQQKW